VQADYSGDKKTKADFCMDCKKNPDKKQLLLSGVSRVIHNKKNKKRVVASVVSTCCVPLFTCELAGTHAPKHDNQLQ
jgi:hypothetical protein